MAVIDSGIRPGFPHLESWFNSVIGGEDFVGVGTPGTSYGAITVGAASIAANERVLRRLQFPSLPSGAMYRPFSGTQTAFFSSRGPDADGHSDPDIVASGFANFGQGFFTPDDITFASGTSVAAPMVTGIAAVLRERFPALSARQVRNAIIATGVPDLLQDDSTALDRGTGYVDALSASLLLSTGTVCDTLYTPRSGGSVKSSSHDHDDDDDGDDDHGCKRQHQPRCVGAGDAKPVRKLNVHSGFVRQQASNLKPGERFEVLYRVLPNTSRVIVTVSDFNPGLPSGQQNPLFGDDVFLRVHSAKTSAIGDGDYLVTAFTTGSKYEINNPEQGLMRVTLSGTWTNAGAVSARVSIVSDKDPLPSFTAQGKVSQGQTLAFPVNVPAGVGEAEFRLSFHDDWASYPTNDIDMLLVKPDGSLLLDGATLNAPERVIVNNPAPGTWYVLVDGFAVYGSPERFELRVTLDGQLVK
ncbi:MAG TPA: S8 family serine peptidase [Terriglobales bacterium]|nr:S8 family serine peptidase [Terriglobales bacterium]